MVESDNLLDRFDDSFTPKMCQADGRWVEPPKRLIQKAFLRRNQFYFMSRSGLGHEQNREYGAKL